MTSYIIKLVLVVCMNSDCTVENAYELDSFQSVEYFDALNDCLAQRNSGNAGYAQLPNMNASLHCWTPSELIKMGFN